MSIYLNHAELTAAVFKQWSRHFTDKMHIRGGCGEEFGQKCSTSCYAVRINEKLRVEIEMKYSITHMT